MFDVAYSDPKEHFLLPLLIGLLTSKSFVVDESGFIETSKIYEQLQGFGFTPEQIDTVIIKGNQNKLIETAARRIPQPGQAMPHSLRVTTVGAYHIKHLCYQFSYVDAMIIDTPIFDQKIRSLLSKPQYMSAYLNIAPRLERVEIFRKYLNDQWSNFNQNQLILTFDWNNVSLNLMNNMKYIQPKG